MHVAIASLQQQIERLEDSNQRYRDYIEAEDPSLLLDLRGHAVSNEDQRRQDKEGVVQQHSTPTKTPTRSLTEHAAKRAKVTSTSPDTATSQPSEQASVAQSPPKRKRGRPRKYPLPEPSTTPSTVTPCTSLQATAVETPPPASSSNAPVSLRRSSRHAESKEAVVDATKEEAETTPSVSVSLPGAEKDTDHEKEAEALRSLVYTEWLYPTGVQDHTTEPGTTNKTTVIDVPPVTICADLDDSTGLPIFHEEHPHDSERSRRRYERKSDEDTSDERFQRRHGKQESLEKRHNAFGTYPTSFSYEQARRRASQMQYQRRNSKQRGSSSNSDVPQLASFWPSVDTLRKPDGTYPNLRLRRLRALPLYAFGVPVPPTEPEEFRLPNNILPDF
eukprot:m.16043 g.16043  ORF g.16043 m.16043 type:complete len:389 (+) comp7988_c0_seq1:437-1603(+)